VERQRPDPQSDAIDLYIRTYYSLLRSTGDVRVRSFEEAHAFSDSSLHLGSRQLTPDTSALGYAAARLPSCMPDVDRIVLGQSHEQFEQFGFQVPDWARVGAKGRRRPLRYDGESTLAAFVSSASDIDDLIPIVTAYQIEWNKMHPRLSAAEIRSRLDDESTSAEALIPELAAWLDVEADGLEALHSAIGEDFVDLFRSIARRPSDRRVKLLAGIVQPVPARGSAVVERDRAGLPARRSAQATAGLLRLVEHALASQPPRRLRARPQGRDRGDGPGDEPPGRVARSGARLADDDEEACNLLYFALKAHMRRTPGVKAAVQRWDEASGIQSVADPGQVEVSAQVIELSRLSPAVFDPRIAIDDVERLSESDAVILNIDYPLGMAAYQLLSRLGQGVGPIRGVYVMGKAATLNGRVGDVMISNVVQDEHSQGAYVFRNAFDAGDLEPYLRHGNVLDNQKALTVRSAFLQNRDYMAVFYREGYTVLEMEAGPYLSALYELIDPRRHPRDEIVFLADRAPFDVGILHYASDTPYSRRKELLSKSLGYFGMDSTYACATAIIRRIFEIELASPE
jgi:hypothetical protein